MLRKLPRIPLCLGAYMLCKLPCSPLGIVCMLHIPSHAPQGMLRKLPSIAAMHTTRYSVYVCYVYCHTHHKGTLGKLPRIPLCLGACTLCKLPCPPQCLGVCLLCQREKSTQTNRWQRATTSRVRHNTGPELASVGIESVFVSGREPSETLLTNTNAETMGPQR